MDESVVKHLEQVDLGTLKLSSLIRIGARIRPQCRGRYFTANGSCALGAAMEAKGYGPSQEKWMVYETVCNVLGIPEKLAQQIAKKNDFEKWTREGIANWLERRGL